MMWASLLVTVLACCLLKRLLLPPLARLPVQLQPMEMRVWGWDIMAIMVTIFRCGVHIGVLGVLVFSLAEQQWVAWQK